MEIKKNIFIMILLFLIIAFFITFGSYFYILNKQTKLLDSLYFSTHQNIIKTTQNLIKDKQNATLAIALALAKDDNLYECMKNENYEKLNYKLNFRT